MVRANAKLKLICDDSMRCEIIIIIIIKTLSVYWNLGIRCIVNNDTYDSIEATVPGPKETPYEEMKFRISMDFDSHYPFRPPVVKFVTPVYHPNIDRGEYACT